VITILSHKEIDRMDRIYGWLHLQNAQNIDDVLRLHSKSRSESQAADPDKEPVAESAVNVASSGSASTVLNSNS